MRHYSAKKILELPRLSHLLYDAQDNFTPEKLITDLGLYEGVLIDAEELDCEYSEYYDTLIYRKHYKLEKVTVSEDVKALHRFLIFEDSFMLPCAECRQHQPFFSNIAFNPLKQTVEYEKNSSREASMIKIIPIKPDSQPAFDVHEITESTPFEIKYRVCQDSMPFNRQLDDVEPDTEPAALNCVNIISKYFCEIRRDFVCSLNNDHHVTAYYIIHKAVDVCKVPKYSAAYEKLKYCLVLEKVGQEPSMADLQMFDIEKYKKVLSSDSFRDFSMALGLYASGVGCGSLLYLRRIYETLIKNAQDKCSKQPEWNEEEYNKRRFNEKIEYLESLGEKIIPDDLLDVKDKIYGWLSKGVHELPEQESMELFPHLKLAMELILDEQIAQKDREEKLKGLKKTLQK